MALMSYQSHLENLTRLRASVLNGAHQIPLQQHFVSIHFSRRARCAILFHVERQLAIHERSKTKVLQLLTAVSRPSPRLSHLFDI